jgi:hypothetical protein
MTEPKGTADEDIGRPGPWGEGRYQKPGEPVEVSVRTPPGTAPKSHTPVSTPVTRRDYETPAEREQSNDDTSEPPGGDAG